MVKVQLQQQSQSEHLLQSQSLQSQLSDINKIIFTPNLFILKLIIFINIKLCLSALINKK